MRRFRLTFCIFLAAIAGALLVPAVGLAAGTGAISGAVVDGSSHLPLEGIEVCARRPLDLGPTGCAFTAANGQYTIASLSTSIYEVRFSPQFGGPNPNYLTQYYSGESEFGEGDPVAVSEGATTASIDAEMQLGGEIAGTVTDADLGTPLQGAMVCATPAKGRPISSHCVPSDASGEYAITALPPGSYKVRFVSGSPSTAGYLPQYYDDQPSSKLAVAVSVTGGSIVEGIDAPLHLGGKITGKVVDANGKAPIQWAQVCAARSGPAPIVTRCVSTNASGEYTIEGLASGEYIVSFGQSFGGSFNYVSQYYDGKASREEAEPVAVTAGTTTAGVDAELAEAGRVSGEVIDAVSKDPAPTVRVCAIDAGAEQTSCDITDDEGEYAIQGLSSGSYRVRFAPGQEFGFGTPPNYNYVSHYFDGKLGADEADPVLVTEGATTTGIDTEMEEGGKIAGRVTDADTEAPVRFVQVCAFADDEISQCASTDDEGEYRIEGLVTGSYKVWFSGGYGGPQEGEAGYLGQYYDGKASLAEAEPVAVTAGATTIGIDGELHPGGRIQGRVTAAADGSPLHFVEACAFEAGGEEEPVRCGISDGKGEYTISGLPSGSYRVRFSAGYFDEEGFVEEFTTQYYSGKASLALSSPISVTAGSIAASIDAAMVEPGGGEGEAGGGSPGGGPAPSGMISPAPTPGPPVTGPVRKPPKPLKCRKGTRKQKVHGRSRCVKVKRHSRSGR